MACPQGWRTSPASPTMRPLPMPSGAAASAIDAARAAWPDPAAVLASAARARRAIRSARAALGEKGRGRLDHRLARKERELAHVLVLASGLEPRAWAEPLELPPGGRARLQIARSPLARTGHELTARPRIPPGWHAVTSAPDDADRLTFELTAAADAPPTSSFPEAFDALGGNGEAGVVLAGVLAGEPVEIALDLEEPLRVLPAIAVEPEPDSFILNTRRDPAALTAVLRLQALATGERIATTPELALPRGWRLERDLAPLEVAGATTLRASLVPPAGHSTGHVAIPITLDGRPAQVLRRGYYPHIGSTARASPAMLRVRSLDVALPAARVGYVGGGNDRVDVWLERLGLEVERLGPGALTPARLAGRNVLLVGIMAFRTRPDLAAGLPSLHAWVAAGGHLVTLYHRPWDNWDPERTPPARLEIGKPSLRWRVTDPAAPVRVLDPQHPLLTRPNRIGPEDWVGWVRERGLYFAARWADAYRPLLAMADRGEAPLAGSLLSAAIGHGRHTHTSLALHLQLEALVPGAFRLLANLCQPA